MADAQKMQARLQEIERLKTYEVMMEQEYADTQEAIADLARAVGMNPEKWDNDSCPNNSDMVKEITAHVLNAKVQNG